MYAGLLLDLHLQRWPSFNPKKAGFILCTSSKQRHWPNAGQCWTSVVDDGSALATIGPISCVCLTVVMVEWSSCRGQPVCDLIVVTLHRMSGQWSVGQAAWVGYYKIITCAHKVIWTVPLRAEVASACHKTLEIKGCMYHFAKYQTHPFISKGPVLCIC